MERFDNGALVDCFTLEDEMTPARKTATAKEVALRLHSPCFGLWVDGEDMSELYCGSKSILNIWVKYLKGFSTYANSKFTMKRL